MNARIGHLRQKSLEARPHVSAERALLLTRAWQSGKLDGLSVPVARARILAYMLANKSICIEDGELIVGERGPAPHAVPTYPEICLHRLQDLDVLDSREKTPFAVDRETRTAYRETIIPFWRGKSLRERLFAELPAAWKKAYSAGVFTEFLEQRAPGHTVLGEKMFQMGLQDLIRQIRRRIRKLDFFNDPLALDKRAELHAMEIAAAAVIAYARRHARKLAALAASEIDAARRRELVQMARICEHVPAYAPRTFWEALQGYWFLHLGVIIESNPWDAFNPGRLDQHLYPFYRREIDAGTLSRETARELLQALWIKFNNHPAPPKVGITAKESNTYVDFALINLGGLKKDGSDAVNAVSDLILDVVAEMRLLQPSAMVQISKKTPDRFLKRALRIVKTGFGQPSVFNSDAIVQELLRQGKTIEDARCGGASGCVESGAFGRESYTLSGYFNLPKVLEITLHNGIDPLSGRRLGPQTGGIEDFKSFDDLFDAFQRQLRHFVDIKIRGNNIIARMHAKYLPVPFLSLLIDDCIRKGRDYNDGGARYNTTYIQGVGLGSITDALTAIRYHVFDRRRLDLPQLMRALNANFEGHAALRRQLLTKTPKYGNDDDYPDRIMTRVFAAYHDAVNGRPDARGGVHRINLLPTTVHVYFGAMLGAMPDGRLAGEPLSEGVSPVQGADTHGPTAVLKSAAKIDHLRTGGTLLNQKFMPDVLKDETGITKLAQLVRGYFSLDGHHIQFNVVDARTLRAAQKQPEKYRDLIVRVAGYSDYFVDLTRELQEEIIRRTAHGGF